MGECKSETYSTTCPWPLAARSAGSPQQRSTRAAQRCAGSALGQPEACLRQKYLRAGLIKRSKMFARHEGARALEPNGHARLRDALQSARVDKVPVWAGLGSPLRPSGGIAKSVTKKNVIFWPRSTLTSHETKHSHVTKRDPDLWLCLIDGLTLSSMNQ